MNADQAKTAAETLAGLWEGEFPATCQVLAAVKEDNRTDKPDAKSRTTWELAKHLAVVEFIPAERFVMRTAEGPFPRETTYEWQAMPDGGTRMTLRNRGTPSGFALVMAPFIAMAMRRAKSVDDPRRERTQRRLPLRTTRVPA